MGPQFDAMGRAREVVSLLDPTGIRPTAMVAGVILALFFGAQLVNALIPVPQGLRPGGPGNGPVNGPGQPGQTLPPIVVPTGAPTPIPGTTPVPGTTPAPVTTPIPGTTPVPGTVPSPAPGSGQVIDIGGLVIPVEAGWQVGAGDDKVAIRVFKGPVVIDVSSLGFPDGGATPELVYAGYIQYTGDGVPGFTSIPPVNIQIGGARPAVRGSYSGVYDAGQLEGDITAFVGSDNTIGWVWDIWAPAGNLQPLLGEARRMIDNIRVTQ
jgi:hypothetical protein